MMRSDQSKVYRGELHWVDWSPSRGSEQTGRRPALVIQENPASANPNYPLTIVVAVSTKGRGIPSHVSVIPTERNGLSSPSFVKCGQVQTISKSRLDGILGRLDEDDLTRVDDALRRVLGLG